MLCYYDTCQIVFQGMPGKIKRIIAISDIHQKDKMWSGCQTKEGGRPYQFIGQERLE